MAKVQVAMAVTLDGFLPEDNENLMQWVRTNKRGFPRWRKECAYPLFLGYPLLDLVCNKEKIDDSFIFQVEVSDKESVELLKGLFLYHIVDEIILYLIPVTANKGIHVMQHVSPCCWSLQKVRQYPDGICLLIYRKRKKLS